MTICVAIPLMSSPSYVLMPLIALWQSSYRCWETGATGHSTQPCIWSPESAEGVLLFTLLDGPTDTSSLVLLNATSLHVLEEVALPMRVPFTTHGRWYGAQKLVETAGPA